MGVRSGGRDVPNARAACDWSRGGAWWRRRPVAAGSVARGWESLGRRTAVRSMAVEPHAN